MGRLKCRRCGERFVNLFEWTHKKKKFMLCFDCLRAVHSYPRMRLKFLEKVENYKNVVEYNSRLIK